MLEHVTQKQLPQRPVGAAGRRRVWGAAEHPGRCGPGAGPKILGSVVPASCWSSSPAGAWSDPLFFGGAGEWGSHETSSQPYPLRAERSTPDAFQEEETLRCRSLRVSSDSLNLSVLVLTPSSCLQRGPPGGQKDSGGDSLPFGC